MNIKWIEERLIDGTKVNEEPSALNWIDLNKPKEN